MSLFGLVSTALSSSVFFFRIATFCAEGSKWVILQKKYENWWLRPLTFMAFILADFTLTTNSYYSENFKFF